MSSTFRNREAAAINLFEKLCAIIIPLTPFSLDKVFLTPAIYARVWVSTESVAVPALSSITTKLPSLSLAKMSILPDLTENCLPDSP